jgi:hypothetical protein
LHFLSNADDKIGIRYLDYRHVPNGDRVTRLGKFAPIERWITTSFLKITKEAQNLGLFFHGTSYE